MNYYTWLNDTYYVKKIREDLYEDLRLWRTDVIKLYTSGPGTEMRTSVRTWDGEQYVVEKKSALDLSIMVENMMQYVNQTTDLFSNRSVALKHPYVRFMLDNTNSITNYFTAVRDREIKDYTDGITMLRSLLLASNLSIGILAFLFALVMPYFSYSSFIARYASCWSRSYYLFLDKGVSSIC